MNQILTIVQKTNQKSLSLFFLNKIYKSVLSMVGMKYRNNQQIVESILVATKDVGMDGIQVTKLMQTSNLSYTRLGKFMSKLTGSGLINKIEYDGKSTFVITENGRVYLQEYQKFLQITDAFGLDL